MVNKKIWLGMLVIVLAFGMAVVGCNTDTDAESDAITGTWVSETARSGAGLKLVASSGSWKQHLIRPTELEFARGTYSCSDNTANVTITEVNTIMFGGADAWVKWAELSVTEQGNVGGSQTFNATITGNSFEFHGETFTKQ
jgi:hypothetical protein